MESKSCTACGYDGTLTRLACPTCEKEQWYCSDCRVGSRAYNCGECQAPQEAVAELVPCPMCGAGMCGDPEEIKAGLLLICDGCHHKFDKKAEPGYPGIYGIHPVNMCLCGQDCGDRRN